jgi:hypothetical protein
MYRRGAYGWGVCLTGVGLAGLSFLALWAVSEPPVLGWTSQLGAVLTAIAVLFQFWLRPRAVLLYQDSSQYSSHR